MPPRKPSQTAYTLSSSDEEPDVKLPPAKTTSNNKSIPTRMKSALSSLTKLTNRGSDSPLMESLAGSQLQPTTMVKKFIDIEKRKIGMTRDQYFQFYNQLLILDYFNQEDRDPTDLPMGLAEVFAYFSEVTGVKPPDSSFVSNVLREESIAEPSTSTILSTPSTPGKLSQESPEQITTPIVEDIPKKRKSIKRNANASNKKAKVETPTKAKRTKIKKQALEIELAPDEYIVEKLLAKKVFRKQTKYLVKWAGYPDSDNSWEPVANISPDLVHNFEQNRSK